MGATKQEPLASVADEASSMELGDECVVIARDLASLLSNRSPVRTRVLDGRAERIMLEFAVEETTYLVVDVGPPAIRNVLSPRELEIARLVANGLPNKAIGAVLDISAWTVATHLRRIFAKLDVMSRAAMVGRLAELGALRDRRPVSDRSVPQPEFDVMGLVQGRGMSTTGG
jgi:DNA-binding CsgD family transcriptional regulator